MPNVLFALIIIGLLLAFFSIVYSLRVQDKNGVEDMGLIKEIEEISSIHIKKFHTVETFSSSDLIWTDLREVPRWNGKEDVSRLSAFPEKGKRYLIWLSSEKKVSEKEPFWGWYQSPQSMEEGLITHSNELGQVGFVSCNVVQELERLMKGTWYEIEVVKTLPLSEIGGTVPVDPFTGSIKAELLEHIHCEMLWADLKWTFLSSNPVKHSGQWVIVEKCVNENRIVAYSHWIKERHEVYIMNLPISGSEAEYLTLQAKDRHSV